MNALISETI